MKNLKSRLLVAGTTLLASASALASIPVPPDSDGPVVSVPEPSTLGLFALGIASVIVVRRLRK